MSYPWPSTQQILLTDASAMTARFRSSKSSVLNPGYSTSLCNSETFNLADVNSMLAIPGAAGLRAYYGMDENDIIHLVLVAVDEDGNDLVPSSNTSLNGDPLILEQGIRCPPTCPGEESPLNS